MIEHEAFLAQARSDFVVFELLMAQDRQAVPECHALHYLQMATEKLAKAIRLAYGDEFDRYSHVAFSQMLHILRRPDVGAGLGWPSWPKYRAFVTRLQPLLREIDECNPAVGPQRPGNTPPQERRNVEYPWPSRDSSGRTLWLAPSGHDFGIVDKLNRSGDYATLRHLIRSMMDRFESVFGSLGERQP